MKKMSMPAPHAMLGLMSECAETAVHATWRKLHVDCEQLLTDGRACDLAEAIKGMRSGGGMAGPEA